MLKRLKRNFFLLFLGISFFNLKILTIKAAPIVNNASDAYEKGDYTLNDLVYIFIRVSEWILGIVGSLALIMFVYGGLLFLFSQGNNEKITQGKTVFKNAIIGLFIVFLSFMIIGMVFKFTGAIPPEGGTAWNKIDWFQSR